MSGLSIQVRRRGKAVEHVREAAAIVGPRLESMVGGILGAAAAIGLQSFLSALVAYVLALYDKLVGVDQAHAAELADDAHPRALRDQQRRTLRTLLVTIRQGVATAYGEPEVRALGFKGETPRETEERDMVALGKLVAERLQVWNPKESKVLGLSFDPSAYVGPLQGAVSDLESTLADVTREEREASETSLARRVALDEFDRWFSLLATVVSAVLLALGEKERAARIRPSTRRKGEVAAQDEEPVEETEAAPAVA